MVNHIFMMTLPLEVRYLIYDYIHGTMVHNYNAVMNDINNISYLFTSHNPDINILLILTRYKFVNIQNWNLLWYNNFYDKFFNPVSSMGMLKKNISLQTIPRLFVNFSMIKYTNIFMDIK